MKFAVANIPQRTSLGRIDLPINTDTYNTWLAEDIVNWGTASSPVALVKFREAYDCELDGCPAGYDGLHPNALGEYQIASAFSQALVNSLKIGRSPLSIPAIIPARPLPVPSGFSFVSSNTGVTGTWKRVYGAYNYDIESRISGGPLSIGSVPFERYDQMWALKDTTYEIRVRATAGDTQKGDWTAWMSATVTNPATLEGPDNIKTRATATGVEVTWTEHSQPHMLYNVIFWDRDTECVFISGAGFKGSSARIDGLLSGHRYLILVETWTVAGPGFPRLARDVRVNSPRPGIPQNLQIAATDPTSVKLTWNGRPAAAGYRVWKRYTGGNEPLSPGNGTSTETCGVDFLLFPGTWNYEYCVSAFNGNDESAYGSCQVAPHPPPEPYLPAPTCPGPREWCPNGGSSWGPDPEDPSGGSPGSVPPGSNSGPSAGTGSSSGITRTSTAAPAGATGGGSPGITGPGQAVSTTMTGANGQTTVVTQTLGMSDQMDDV